MNRELQELSGRVEALLDDARATGDPRAVDRGEELVRAVMGLYGAGLARVVELAAERGGGAAGGGAEGGGGDGAAGDRPAGWLLRLLADDEVVGGLLVLHDLHPDSVETRVRAALDRVRPYLGSHSGGVAFTGVDDDGVAHLTLEGSCHGCPSSAVTVTTTLERAVLEAAPEVVAVDVAGVLAPERPVFQIGLRPGLEPAAAPEGPVGPWEHLDRVPAPGALRPVDLAGTPVLLANLAGTPYAYRDRCPGCGRGLGGSDLAGDVLTCATCAARYDIRLAGRGLEPGADHLEPLPLLPEGEGWAVAVPEGVSA